MIEEILNALQRKTNLFTWFKCINNINSLNKEVTLSFYSNAFGQDSFRISVLVQGNLKFIYFLRSCKNY